MKDSIKRAQSRAGSGFAERENFRPKVKQQKTKQLIMTLALLLTAATGAWATVHSGQVSRESLQVGDILVKGAEVTSSRQGYGLSKGSYKLNGSFFDGMAVFEAGPLVIGDDGLLALSTTTNFTPYDADNDRNGNAWKVVETGNEVYGVILAGTTYPKPTPFAITWSAATPNTASIDKMPAGNVTVSVDYFPQAAFAMSTDPTPVALAPTAIANVPANTDAPIVTPGTVANIGTSEVPQGTLMYFVSQPTDNTIPDTPDYDTRGWSENVPTANELKQGDVYVWYYIQGAEPATIAERTDANTRSDSDIMPLGANGIVTLDPEPTYDVSLNKTGMAEGEPALWKAKSTNVAEVNLGTNDLKGVKKSETVTVTYSGTKKIIGVKAEKTKTITIGTQVYTVLPGETWSQFITRNQLSDWMIMKISATKYNVYNADTSSTLYVRSDGTSGEPLELTSEDAPIDTDKQYYWEDVLP